MEKLSNIGIFSLAYAPFVGGAELAVKEITDRLTEFEFTCITHRFLSEWPERESIGNVSVVRVGTGNGLYSKKGKFLYIFRAWRAAEALHRERPFQAMWAIMAAYGGLGALLFKLRHPRIPLLLTLQEGDEERHILRRVGVFYFFWKLLFLRANAIQAISQSLAQFARRHGARIPVEVIPNGVSEVFFLPRARKINPPFTIITTSRLVKKNGVDTLIEACAKLRQLEISHWQLKIVGDGPERESLKALAIQQDIHARVEFVGHVSPERIPEYLARADIFVRVSRSEGLGSSFLEAMAAGLPIIGTPVGGIPDFLKNGETGLFAKAGDAEDVAKKIERLYKDEALRKRLEASGVALARSHYQWDVIAPQFRKIFNTLCAL